MSSSRRKSEIVTLQFGEYANHVGAHYWNFQDELIGLASSISERDEDEDDDDSDDEEKKLVNQNRFNAIDHECLYRQGETRRGERIQTPRVVAYDLRSSLGGVKQLGYLCDEGDDFFSSTVSSLSSSQIALKTWTGEMRVHEQPRAKKSEYLRRLEEEEEEEEKEVRGEERGAKEEKEIEEDDDREKRKEKNGRVAVVAADDVENDGSDIDRLVEAAKKLKHDAMHWTDFSKAFFHPRTVQVLDLSLIHI